MSESEGSPNLSIRTTDCHLQWIFDGAGEWHAPSLIMDPAMCDEPMDQWCKEWCLSWRCVVLEDGTFAAGQSDNLLLERKELKFKSFPSLDVLMGKIDLAENDLRCDEFFMGGESITLLPIDQYKKP